MAEDSILYPEEGDLLRRIERMRKPTRVPAVTVIPLSKGKKVQLGGGSFSNLVLTSSTLKGNTSMMGYSIFKPGCETKQKVHVGAEEMAYVLAGSGKLTVRDGLISFREGDSLHIPAGVPHGIRNDGRRDLVMIFFFPTPDYPPSVDA